MESACVALGHFHDERTIEHLAKLKNHPSSKVRHGVAYALGGHETDLAIFTLIDLTSDKDPNVRDWATFAIGSQTDRDTPEIRKALLQRLDDGDEDARGEAMVGLARRKNERVIQYLFQELSSDCVGRFSLEAAEALSDSRLLPVLLELKNRWEGDPNLLISAIDHCQKTIP